FLAVVRKGLTQLYGHIQNFMREGGSAADQLARIVLLGFRNSQSEFGRLLSDARIYLSEDQQLLLVERCSDPWTLYESIFTSAVASGELPQIDPTLASTMFVGLIHGQTWSVKTRRIDPPLDDTRARLLVDTLFGGIRSVFGGKTTELLAATCQSQSKLDAAAELAVRSS
ncbi:MAG TPA: hypothetical protein PK691_07485, partial [Thermomicrobiales bacterium]|nr:hypothetical protein [Thermomicrobiales bacterium]